MNANVTEAIKAQIKRKGKWLAELSLEMQQNYANIVSTLQAAEGRQATIKTIMELQDSLNEVPLPRIWTTRKEMELMLQLDSLFDKHMKAFALESRDLVHELQEIAHNKPTFYGNED